MSGSRGVTPQYRIIQRLAPDLKNAVKDDLCDFSLSLLSHGLITAEKQREFMNQAVSVDARASNLITTVLNRIKLDVRHYTVFVGVLEEKEWYYKSVLQKIRSRDEGIVVISEPPLSMLPTSRTDEREHSDSETSPFIQTSNGQHGDESECNAPRTNRRIPSLLEWFCDCIDYNFDDNDNCCCFVFSSIVYLCTSLILMFVLIIYSVVAMMYYYSGCHNAVYILANVIIVVITALLFLCYLIMLLDVILRRRYMTSSCSKQTILIYVTPWLFILLVWFCDFKYTCTT